MKKYDVYINYDSGDQKIVEALSHYLEERHVKCFVTYRDIPRGVDYESFTMEAIGQSQMMLVVFSDVAKMNENMLHNLEVCTEMGKPVLSYRLMNSALYNQNKDYYMTLNWLVSFPNLDECFGAVFRNILSLIRPELVDYKEVMTNVDTCRKNEHLIGLQQKSDGGPEPDFLPETELESDGEPEADILPETVLESDGEPEADFLPETELESEGESKLDSQLVNLEDIASLFEMVPVKGGTFLMGAQAVSSMKDNFDNMAYGDEEPVHTVELSDFQISKTVVTQAQWKAVMGDLNVQVQFVGDNLPVDSVSWNVACDFVSELNAKTGLKFGFPTEAQWEFAARGGVLGKCYKYSGGNDLDAVGWNIRNSSETTHPVAQKSPNELGIFDMSGNVWEWCVDDYCEYSNKSQTNPMINNNGDFHVLRGGSAKNDDVYCRVSSRNAGSTDKVGLIGIRLVLR